MGSTRKIVAGFAVGIVGSTLLVIVLIWAGLLYPTFSTVVRIKPQYIIETNYVTETIFITNYTVVVQDQYISNEHVDVVGITNMKTVANVRDASSSPSMIRGASPSTLSTRRDAGTLPNPSDRAATQSDQPTDATGWSANGLALSAFWDKKLQGGSGIVQDMINILGPYGESKVNLGPNPGIVIFKDVTYLMPLADAIKALSLNIKVSSRNSVTTPGIPANSFFFHSFAGNYEGHYNMMYLVTDVDDKVVAVEFVDESPTDDVDSLSYDFAGGALYNMILARTKGTPSAKVYWAVRPYSARRSGADGSRERSIVADNINGSTAGKGRTGCWQFDSKFVMNSDKNKLRERIRVYLPQPIVDLVLYRCQN